MEVIKKMLAKFIDNELKIVNSNNFNLKKYYGFKDYFEEEVPKFDENIYELDKFYEEDEDRIVAIFEIVDKRNDLNKRVDMLEENDIVHEIALAELYELGINFKIKEEEV